MIMPIGVLCTVKYFIGMLNSTMYNSLGLNPGRPRASALRLLGRVQRRGPDAVIPQDSLAVSAVHGGHHGEKRDVSSGVTRSATGIAKGQTCSVGLETSSVMRRDRRPTRRSQRVISQGR